MGKCHISGVLDIFSGDDFEDCKDVRGFSLGFFGATILLLVVSISLLIGVCCLVRKVKRLKRPLSDIEANGEAEPKDEDEPNEEAKEEVPMTDMKVTDNGGEMEDDMYDSVLLPDAKKPTAPVATDLENIPDYDVIGNEEKEAITASNKFTISSSSKTKGESKKGKGENKEDRKGKTEVLNEYAMVNKKPNTKEGVYNTLQHSVDSGAAIGKTSSTQVCASKLYPDQYEAIGKNGLKVAEGSERRMSQKSMTGGVSEASSPPPPPLPPPISEADLLNTSTGDAQAQGGMARHSQYYNHVPSAELSAEEPGNDNRAFTSSQAIEESEHLIQDMSSSDMQEDLYMNVGANA